MHAAVYYSSRGGNTKKVADAIAEEVGVRALTTEHRLDAPVDLLFIGSGIYKGRIDASLKSFISRLEKDQVDMVAVFSTSVGAVSAKFEIQPLLLEKGIRMFSDAFHCHGKFMIFYPTRPKERDLVNARAFARKCVNMMGGE